MALRQRHSSSSTPTGETDAPSTSLPPPRPAPPSSTFMKIAVSAFALLFLASCVHSVLPATTKATVDTDSTKDMLLMDMNTESGYIPTHHSAYASGSGARPWTESHGFNDGGTVHLSSGRSAASSASLDTHIRLTSGAGRISNDGDTVHLASGHTAAPSASSEMLIWNADITLRAKHGSGAWDAARAHIQSKLLIHGFLESESVSAGAMGNDLYMTVRCVSRSTNATISCPEDVYLEYRDEHVPLWTWRFTWRVEAFHDRLRALEGVPDVVPNTTVASKRVARIDASTEYQDASGRSATLRHTRAALEKLLEQATNVQDIAAIVTQVQDVTEKIEAAESKLLRTSTSVRLSTINVELAEHDAKARVVIVDDRVAPPSTSRWAIAYARAVGVLKQCSNLVIDGIMLALIVGLPIALVLWLGWKLFSRLRQSDHRYHHLPQATA